MVVVNALGRGLQESFFMFWVTLWALVLGFGLSGAVQAFVSRAQMQAALGDHRPRTVAKASFFGVLSSSCSYAASALAKSLFSKGADFTSSMIFMIASTNLVIELGLVLWLLIGWQFALAEFVGGAIMIFMLAIVLPRAVPSSWLEQARANLASAEGIVDPHESHLSADAEEALTVVPARDRIRSRAGWSDAAGYAVSDLTMLRKELLAGYLIAGFLAVLVPKPFWESLFLTGHGFYSSLENVAIGPLLALISFVCSVGNVPLAAALWNGGISFGGVISFVFADLVTLPLLLIYRKYYGSRITLRLLAVFWVTMSVAGLVTEYLFKAVGITPPVHRVAIVAIGFRLDYTAVLDVVAMFAFAYLYWLYRNRERFGGGAGYAKDVVCAMQVQKSMAPATAIHNGDKFYFCSDGCAERFRANPDRYSAAKSVGSIGNSDRSVETEMDMNAQHGEQEQVVDPVCAMAVVPSTAAGKVQYAGRQYYFCSTSCKQRFTDDPLAYLELARDPVCGMDVEVANAPATFTHDAFRYVFCNPGCAERFSADPTQYISEPTAQATER